MKFNKNLVTMGLLGVFGLGLTGYLASSVVPNAFVTMTKAAPAGKTSFNNSLIIGEKVLAAADGKDTIKFSVYVLDANNKGVANKSVTIEAQAEVAPQMAKSDNQGKASFTIKSQTEGQVKVKALVDGTELPKVLTVTFRN